MNKDMEMAERIARLVQEAGGRTFYVGGYVRDLILHRENKDIDIEVHGITPKKLAEILDSVGERTVMGASFGVFGLRHYDLDIAMPRSETANGRGHKDFDIFVDPFIGTKKAAMRRDFTMNALMQDVLTGEILDPFGGVEDIRRGVIRHVNDQTFGEDPLRVLRAAQFAARFCFDVAPETRSISRGMDVSVVARERVMAELEKAIEKAPRPSVFFEELRKIDQLAYWFPQLDAASNDANLWNRSMKALDEAASMRAIAEYPLGFLLTAVCPEGDSLVKPISQEVKLLKYTANMNGLRQKIADLYARRSGADELAELFDEAMSPGDLILLYRADALSEGKDIEEAQAYLEEMLREYRRRIALPFVKGEDLVKAGFAPGKSFGEALKLAHQLHLHAVPRKEALERTCEFLKAQGKNP